MIRLEYTLIFLSVLGIVIYIPTGDLNVAVK